MQKPKESYSPLQEVDAHHHEDTHGHFEHENDEWLNRNLETVKEAGWFKGCRQKCGTFLLCLQCLCPNCNKENIKVV